MIAYEAIKKMTDLNLWANPIVTEVTEFKSFYPAEDDHKDYLANNPNQPYCQFIVRPKYDKFKSVFTESLKKYIHKKRKRKLPFSLYQF